MRVFERGRGPATARKLRAERSEHGVENRVDMNLPTLLAACARRIDNAFALIEGHPVFRFLSKSRYNCQTWHTTHLETTMPTQTEILGDPSVTPFARFEQGTALYPPSSIYECAQIVTERATGADLAALFSELIEKGDCGGSYRVLPRSTWFAAMGNFLHYRGQPDLGPPAWREYCIAGLKLMLRRPHQAAWADLKRFLTENIDEISGWASSWNLSRAKEQRIFRGDDDKYYYHDEDGVLIRVIGAKTLDETRMDFITDQILRGYGFARQFLELFALFSIADDFADNPGVYPPAMKAILADPQSQRVGHAWHCLYHERTRSFMWRPNSNMCDPNWLASDLLGSMTDTLTFDYFRKRIDTRKPDDGWSNDPCRFQVEYVIDSAVKIGSQDEAYIEFEGKTFRWINGTAERDAVVTVPVKDLNQPEEEIAKLNRLLSAIVWEHKHPIRKIWGSAGPRRPFPSVYGPRMSVGVLIDPEFLRYLPNKSLTDVQWLALALFREATNSGSKFYAFLCYSKILDRAFPKLEDRREWINNVAPKETREKDRIGEILKNATDLEKYLREERLNAIKHVLRKPGLNPDDPRDEFKITADLHVVEDLARLAIEKLLK